MAHIEETVAMSVPPTDPPAFVITMGYNMKCIAISIGCLGLLGNLFVILIIFSSKDMRIHRTNIYIVNQCFIDATIALMLILTSILENDGRVFDRDNIGDVLYCRIWLNKLWLWSFMVSSTYNLMTLTFERYLAIVHPFVHKIKITRPKIITSIIAVWLIGPVYNMAYMIPSTRITTSHECTVYSVWPSDRVQAIVGIVTIVVQFIFPLIFLIVCYTLIALNLRGRLSPKKNKSGNGNISPSVANNVQLEHISSAFRNIIRTLFIVSVCFVICWITNQVYYFMFHLKSEKASSFETTFYHFTVVMVFMNCCINPFIYIAQYRAFQRATKNFFCHERRSIWSSTGSENQTPLKSSSDHSHVNTRLYSENQTPLKSSPDQSHANTRLSCHTPLKLALEHPHENTKL